MTGSRFSKVARHGAIRPMLVMLTALSLLPYGVIPIAPADGAGGVTVAAQSATQIVLAYTAPDTNPCTLEASESPTYTPLVNDLNPALFPQANLDGRPGGLVEGSTRVVVI